MTRGERVWVSGPGIQLEGLFWSPGGRAPAPAVVLCHPHPLRGGDMKNYVIGEIWEALAAAELAVLRFNFRGVGRSEGSHDDGVREVDDVIAALDFLVQAPGVDAGRLGVVGYSFGALVGGRAAARDSRVRAVAFIAPPLGIYSLDEAAAWPVPKLALVGDRDEFCPREAFVSWYEKLAAPKEQVLLEGADHFFPGREREVAASVARFISEALQTQG